MISDEEFSRMARLHLVASGKGFMTSDVSALADLLRGVVEMERKERLKPPEGSPLAPKRLQEIRRQWGAGGTSWLREIDDLLVAYDHALLTIDRFEAFLADAYQDAGAAAERAGVAMALEAIRSLSRRETALPPRPSLHEERNRAIRDCGHAVVECCGDHPLPPHLETTARARRYEQALRDVLEALDASNGTNVVSLQRCFVMTQQLIQEALDKPHA